MPIYEYECRECGYRLDALQKMSDPLLVDCPDCAQPGLKKLLSAPYFRLKGSGWYETDFKNSGREKPADAKADGEAKPASKNGKDAGAKTSKDKAASSTGEGASKGGAAGAGADSG